MTSSQCQGNGQQHHRDLPRVEQERVCNGCSDFFSVIVTRRLGVLNIRTLAGRQGRGKNSVAERCEFLRCKKQWACMKNLMQTLELTR